MAARDLDNLDYQGPGDPGSGAGGGIAALLEALAGAGGSGGGAYNVPGSDYGRETPGRGNPYDFSPSGGGSAPLGGPSSSGGGGDRFSRGMEWLGQDIANNGSGRLDRAGPFGGGGAPSFGGNPKEPPGQGDPYASTMAMDPFASAMKRFEDNTQDNYFDQSSAGAPPAPPIPGGPQNNYAGPSVPLGGPGAPVSPFMSENNAFNALNAQNAAQAAAPSAPPIPAAPPEPLSSMFGDVKQGLAPTPAAPTMPPGADLRAFLGQLLGGLGATPRAGAGAPSAPPIPANSPLANPYGIPGMPPLTYGGQTTGVNGLQGSSLLNRQVPANIRGSSIASALVNEEPSFQGALIRPDDGTANQGWNQLAGAMRRPPPAPSSMRTRPRPRF